MSKKPKLYDHSGQPITPSDNQINDGLPPGVQALIEARLNSAIGDIREHNRDDLQDLARAQVKKWRFLTFLSTAIALIAFFIAPQQIVNWIGKQIDKKLTEPMIRESADRLIDTKMSNYVDMKMQPLNKQAGILDANISELKNDIADKQATLQRQQKELADQIKVRELAVAAKAGSRKAYNELLTLKERKPNNLVTSSIKEIELFFDADRGQLSFPILVKKEIMKDPGMSVDEVIQILRSNPKLAEAAINTLSQLKSKASVSELCTLIKTTEDLRLAARATRAIAIITGEKIDPLDFKKVQKWGDLNCTNPIFSGNYDGYCEVIKQMGQIPITFNKLEKFIERLNETIDSDQDAFHSRCLKAGFLIVQGKEKDANALFEEVRKKKQDYRWLYVWESAGKIKEMKIEDAINLLNKAFVKSPTSDIEATVRFWKVFDPVKTSQDVHWPSAEKKDAQQTDSADRQ